MVGSRVVQGMGAPCRLQQLNAKADGVIAVAWLWRGMARRGRGGFVHLPPAAGFAALGQIHFGFTQP